MEIDMKLLFPVYFQLFSSYSSLDMPLQLTCKTTQALLKRQAHRVTEMYHSEYRISKEKALTFALTQICAHSHTSHCLPISSHCAGLCWPCQGDSNDCRVWLTECTLWWKGATGKAINVQLFLLIKSLDKMWAQKSALRKEMTVEMLICCYTESSDYQRSRVLDLKVCILSLQSFLFAPPPH